MIQHIKAQAAFLIEEIIQIRRYIHQNPELSYHEDQTMEYISKILTQWNIEHKKGVGKTGIMGHIHGKKPFSKLILLRADIDALPIQEENEVNYKSQKPNCMHACGHDVHTASLLGTLKILKGMENDFEGSIRFIFQPGEELFPGGATLMIEDGVLKDPIPQLAIGQHVYPDFEAGYCGFKGGEYMASADEITLKVKGKGGHAAMPHKTPDTIITAAHILTQLQNIVSRLCPPQIPSVLSFGHIEGGSVFNIIPSEVLIRGTFRTFDEEWRSHAHKKITEICKNTAHSYDLDCDVYIEKGYPFLFNDVKKTRLSKNFAQDFLGKDYVKKLDLRLGAEDFAYYSHEIPSVFYRLGTSNFKNNIGGALHTSKFNIDESALQTGMGLMAFLSLSHLKELSYLKS
ncbi:MAG: M20 family metallopeptidase [Bacteroidales bacterium]